MATGGGHNIFLQGQCKQLLYSQLASSIVTQAGGGLLLLSNHTLTTATSLSFARSEVLCSAGWLSGCTLQSVCKLHGENTHWTTEYCLVKGQLKWLAVHSDNQSTNHNNTVLLVTGAKIHVHTSGGMTIHFPIGVHTLGGMNVYFPVCKILGNHAKSLQPR
jgi:hypothetical protein